MESSIDDQPRLEIVAGQTASGKTAFALELAASRGAWILNADSLCVYRGMDIGTAKPTADEQSTVPHFAIDLVPASTPFSIGDYVRYTKDFLDRCFSEGRSIVAVGGSGFYLKSLWAPVLDGVNISTELESQVDAWEKEEGLLGLQERFSEVNGEDAPGLDWQNPRRVNRALKRALASRKTYRQLQEEFLRLPAPYQRWKKRIWLLERNSEDLEVRNRKRVDAMLNSGLIEEVTKLQKDGIEQNPSAAAAIGYRETLAMLHGSLPESDLGEQIITNTRKLMRKQRIWFRHQLPKAIPVGTVRL